MVITDAFSRHIPDLLRYLLCVQLFTIVFLCGWTAVNLDFLKEGANSLVDDVRHGRPGAEETGRVCREQWWDYVIEVAEVAVLVVGKSISGDH